MPSKNRVTIFLSDEDKKLYNRAIKLYNKKASELGKEILHSWLFANKLQIEGNQNE